MRLYVANETRQNIRFNYRLPESKRYFVLAIGIGQQEAIPHDLNSAELKYVIEQLEQGFGAVDSKNLDRAKFFVGVCYSEGLVIPPKLIERGVNNNLIILEKRGEQFRKETAVANHAAADFGRPGLNELVKSRTKITEVPARGSAPKLNETFIVAGDNAGEVERGDDWTTGIEPDNKPRTPRRKAG